MGEMGCVVMNAPVEMQAIKTKYKFNVQEAFACWKPRYTCSRERLRQKYLV